MVRPITLILLLIPLLQSAAGPDVVWYRPTSYYYKDSPSNEYDSRLAVVNDLIYVSGFSDGSGEQPHLQVICYGPDGSLIWNREKTTGSAKLIPGYPVSGGILPVEDAIYVVGYLNRISGSQEYSVSIIKLGRADGIDAYDWYWLLGIGDAWTTPIYPSGIEVVRDSGKTFLFLVGTYLELGKTPRGFIARLEDLDGTLKLSWFRILYRKLFTRSEFKSIEWDGSSIYVSGSFLREGRKAKSGFIMKIDVEGRIDWAVEVSSLEGRNVVIHAIRPLGDEVRAVGEGIIRGEPVEGLYLRVNPLTKEWKSLAFKDVSLRSLASWETCDQDIVAGYVYNDEFRRNMACAGMIDGDDLVWSAAWGDKSADFYADDLDVGDAVYIVGGDDNVSGDPAPRLTDLNVRPVEGRFTVSFTSDLPMEDEKASIVKTPLDPDPLADLREYFSPKSRDGFLLKLEVPTNLTIEVSPPGSGNTDPGAGVYVYRLGSEVSVSAMPGEGWTFDHWELDGEPAGSSPELRIAMCVNHTLVAHFTKLQVETGGGEESEAGESMRGGAVTSPTLCQLAFDRFPHGFRFMAREQDVKFNEDVLTRFFLGSSLPEQRAIMIVLGGPEKILFDWRSVGVEFLRERGTYSAIRLLGSGNVYWATFGSIDYSVIYRDCTDGVIRVAGVTRYGTRAGLLWVINHVEGVVDGPDLRVVKWEDWNGDRSVELWEISPISP